MKKYKPLIPSFVLMLLIMFVDFLPSKSLSDFQQSSNIPYDKIVHFIQHASLACLLFWGFLHIMTKKIKNILLSIIIPFIIGLFIEIIQEYFIPYRHFSYADLLANILGSLFLFPMMPIIIKIYDKFKFL